MINKVNASLSEKILLRAAYALEKQLCFWDIMPDI